MTTRTYIPSIRTAGRSRRGVALIATVTFVLIFGLIIGYIMNAVTVQQTNVYRTQIAENSMAAAEVSLKQMTSDIKFILSTRPPQMDGVITSLNNVIPAMQRSNVGGSPYYEVVEYQGAPLTYIRNDGPNDFEFRVVNDPTDPWNGYSTARLSYEIVAFARESSERAERMAFPGAGLAKRITIDYIPLYQYAIFYDGSMELHPGPAMDVRGRVHANGNMYLGSKNRLTFHRQVTSAGFIRGYSTFDLPAAPNSSGPAGTLPPPLESAAGFNSPVEFLNAAGTAFSNMRASAPVDTNGNGFLDSLDTNWLAESTLRWGTNVVDVQKGQNAVKPPLPLDNNGQSVDASIMIQRADANDRAEIASVKFENKADYVISGDPGQPGTIRIRDAHGNVIPNVDPLNPALPPLVTTGVFQDGQQQALVRTLDVNIAAFNQRGLSLGNGVIYATTTPGPGDSWSSPTTWGKTYSNFTSSPNTTFTAYMPAIRIENAQDLPRNTQNGFTFATDRPLYTVGDINTQGGANARATAILAADAVTVLSKKLTFAETTNSSNGRFINTGAARSTETNAIFLMGETASTFDSQGRRVTQSGGAHNVLRYLENWGGITHTYNGSEIVLFGSRVAVRPWSNVSGWFNWGGTSRFHEVYYNPPNRAYNWDARLQSAIPPPGMPMVLTVLEGDVTRISRDYAIANRPR